MPISKVISKARPDHPSLDFDVLRAEGIQHLENFATELWTDYNAHDPGITLLELLCYAITDLSYRTRLLPIEDLMVSPNTKLKPWYSASEILPSAPLTVLDYRKLLIDVKGVKNAWLLKGRQEIHLFFKEVVFPDLSDATGQLDKEKLRAFVIENCSEIFPDKSCPPEEIGASADSPSAADAPPADDSSETETPPKPQINFDVVLTKVVEAQENIKLFPLIQLYIEAIKEARLERKSKSVLERIFTDSKQEVSQEELNIIYEYTKRFPFERNLPQPDPTIKREFDLIKNEYATYEDFVAGAINSYDYASIDLGDDVVEEEDIQAVKDYLLRVTTDPLEEDTVAYRIFEAVPSSNRGSGDLEKKRNKLIQEEFKRLTEEKNLDKFFLVEAYFSQEPALQELFSPSFKSKWFLELGGIKGWTFEICILYNFLYNAFNISQELIETVIEYHQNSYNVSAPSDEDEVVKALFSTFFCKYGVWELGFEQEVDPNADQSSIVESSVALSGLYTILLDLDEEIDTGVPNLVNPILQKVRNRIDSNRGLCEDYVDIKVVQQRPIEICLSLEIEPSADEVKIVAEAVRKMQEYLSPVPRFRTFQERLDELRQRGENCSAENVYNGPLLDNGFLEDHELGDNHPRTHYYHSDLVREIMSIDGIMGLPVLKIEPTPEINEPSSFIETTAYGVYEGDFANQPGQFFKPVIDIQGSYFEVTKGARTFEMNIFQVEEYLQLLRLINSPDPLDPPGGPVAPTGTYRPDLSAYPSLQFDLPATYMVGDHPPPLEATPRRHAQVKHLQAYLAFFDQILASYLAQLGRVKELLSVDQDASAPTRILPLLYDVPGLRELIGEEAAFVAEPLDWTIIIQHVREDLFSISAGRGNVEQKSDRTLVEEWLQGIRESTIAFAGFQDLDDRLLTELSMTASPPYLIELYGQLIHDHFWKKFKSDPENYYAQQLMDLTESSAVRQRRTNELLDHLLARFGEAFSTYAAALLRPEAEPEDNPRLQNFQEYLEAKADFLREVANLAMDRNLGYNYRAFLDAENVSDVWNTDNVSGLQKRVIRKLGIPSWETRSLIAPPAYRIDKVPGRNRRGLANYKAALRRRLGENTDLDNPEQGTPLLTSPAYPSNREAQNRINELYKYIWQANFFEEDVSIAEIEAPYWFRLQSTPGGKYRAILVKQVSSDKGKKIKQGGEHVFVEILLRSELLSEDEAKDRILKEIIPLVRPSRQTKENEGFHIVEHILLRPKETDDPLLQLHLGCVPEETPKDPYSFWITVVAPASTTRFSDEDFRAFFEHEFRMETPAHIAVRFCYLDLDDMYKFEEAFAIWMFEKAKCDPPNHCRVDEAAANLIELLNSLPCSCPCPGELEEPSCGQESI